MHPLRPATSRWAPCAEARKRRQGQLPIRDAYRPQGLYGLTNRAALVPLLNLRSFQPRGNCFDALGQPIDGAGSLLLEPLQAIPHGRFLAAGAGFGELIQHHQRRYQQQPRLPRLAQIAGGFRNPRPATGRAAPALARR